MFSQLPFSARTFAAPSRLAAASGAGLPVKRPGLSVTFFAAYAPDAVPSTNAAAIHQPENRLTSTRAIMAASLSSVSLDRFAPSAQCPATSHWPGQGAPPSIQVL